MYKLGIELIFHSYWTIEEVIIDIDTPHLYLGQKLNIALLQNGDNYFYLKVKHRCDTTTVLFFG